LRSPAERWRGLWLAAALVGGSAAAAEPLPAPSAVTVEQVRGVVAEMRGDPAFANRHTERRLRLIDTGASRPPPAPVPAWLRGLARWLAQGGRGLMWVLGAVGVALLIVFAWRWARVRAEAAGDRAALRTSHVNDLDIRPESLPDDIAAAAAAWLARGARRAALSLLYRGALSRLVHVHGVAVRAASTEGECLRLAQATLPPAGGRYFETLVAAWQTEVYAGRAADTAVLSALCAQFDAHFAPAAPAIDARTATGAAA
jgi:hypothetical protein